MFHKFVLVLILSLLAQSPPAQAGSTAPKTVKIDIQGFAFAPALVSVHVGDTIEWTNRDFAPHTATADDAAADTGLLKNGASGQIVASVPGPLTYHCKFHPGMKGVIMVEPAPSH